ncbi:S-DNA-T family DNA segregation ATPase FtsK/SpoIIIE [Bacillus thermophilus]|uniref:S-DNA-T family DNA segregation ATPase FtsK/SpoIIIE n=1 Tax=Siminovitchia thermophila TaxID=1245522 RepID=A0ABS2R6G8_9BACI|nr:S-DNA-T family DNA segregation ATPase FtsK/SpoIIIE [Siminovitchia thermophila]
MKWWKKFLSTFFSEEEMIEDTKEHVAANELHKSKQHTEMKTRVTYQYPKGEFRFPLIKDPPQKSRTERKEQNQSKHPSPRSPEIKTGRTDQKRVAQSVPKESREQPYVKEGWRKVEPKNSRPFEPTNIPSPVHGFHRPKKQRNNAPEFELTASFSRQFSEEVKEEELKNEFETHSGFNSGSNQDSEVEIFPAHENIEEDPFEEEIPDIEFPEEEKAIQEAASALEPVPWQEKPFKTDTESEDLHEFAENHDESVLMKNKLEKTPVDIKVDDEKELNATTYSESSSSAKVDEYVETMDSDTTLDSPTEKVPSIGDAEDKIAQTESIEVESLIQDQTEKTHTALALEEQENAEKRTDFESGVQQPEDSRSSNQEEKKREEPAQTSKSKQRAHLPFNVLMLSQDKLKWQKQKNKEAAHSRSPIPGKSSADESKETNDGHSLSYVFPRIDLLEPPVARTNDEDWVNEQSALLDETLENFNVKARVVKASQGPSVTRFEVQPDPGVKVNKITNLSNDIKLSMAARDIRMEAPIPGTRSIGIELPNKQSRPVQISEIIGSDTFFRSPSPLTAALGLDISGAPVVTDLRKMPHGLIAGATGSGKSVCINSILVSLLYKARPDELKLLLVDPKMVELAPYNYIPHLVSPVITDVKAATAALKWAVDEMEHRYELFVHANVRDINRFNKVAEKNGKYSDKLPYIVIIIDELADLMMVAPAEVEESICRIAQKARACGIHLLIATQRPSVDVITGLIKANVPTRIAFSVSSQVDSRTVIDVSGAEKLLGRGDMLFLNNGSVKPVRLQGTFVSDEEIDRVIEHVRDQGEPQYLFKQEELLKKAELQENEDELFVEACEFVIKQGHASTSLLQRQFRIGYNRAARLMEMMEERGVITGARGSRPRDVLIKEEDLHSLKDSLVQ